MAVTIGLFFFSLTGISGLLALKEWERRSGRTLAPALRAKLDSWAMRLKELLTALRTDLEKLPPEILHISRIVVHEIALALAALLRLLSLQAHRLADLVSHKHSFRPRAPRSEFLKKVSEHKSGSDNGANGLA